eukprot:PhF_6_TR4545/c0_g1_i1/m.6408
MFYLVVLLLTLCHHATADCNMTDVSKCINLTTASPAVGPEAFALRECYRKANGTRAFVCRCTLKVFSCLVNQSCSYTKNPSASKTSSMLVTKRNPWSAEELCKEYVRAQDLDCNEYLCRWYAGAGTLNLKWIVVAFSLFLMLVIT